MNNYVGTRVGAHANSMTGYAGNKNCYMLGNEVRNDEGIALTMQNGDGNNVVAFNQFITLGGDSIRVSWHPDDIGRSVNGRLFSKDRDFFANNLALGRDHGKNAVFFHSTQVEGMTVINNIWNAGSTANMVDDRTTITYGIESFTIDNPGTGYKYLDVLSYTNGTGAAMEAIVTAVGPSGEIERIGIRSRGRMTTEPTLAQKSFTGGSGSGALFTPTATGRSSNPVVSGNHFLRDFSPNSTYTPTAASAERNGDVRAWTEGPEDRYFADISGDDIYAWDLRAGTADISSPGRYYPWTFNATHIDPRWFPQFDVGGAHEAGIPVTCAGWSRPDGDPVIDWDNLQLAAV